MPIYDPYAEAIGNRPAELTSLVRGWRNPDAPRMATARGLVDSHGLMPVLFRPLDRPVDDHTVTHAAVCGLLAFRSRGALFALK